MRTIKAEELAMAKKLEKDGPWVGAYAVVQRVDGTLIVGRVLRWTRISLDILCDWGSADIPLRNIAKVHYS